MKSPRLDEELCSCGRWGCLLNRQTVSKDLWMTPRELGQPWSTIASPSVAIFPIHLTMNRRWAEFEWSTVPIPAPNPVK
jgi:hypothetical protein